MFIEHDKIWGRTDVDADDDEGREDGPTFALRIGRRRRGVNFTQITSIRYTAWSGPRAAEKERRQVDRPTGRANAICKPVVDDDVSSSIILGVVNIANSRREREREGKERERERGGKGKES